MNKKSFKNNPALQFVSKPEPVFLDIDAIKRENDTEPTGTMAFETKSKRVNLLLRPSLHEGLKKKAQSKGTSINNLMNVIIESYIENDGSVLK